MGLFDKVPCALCGKELGLMGKNKLSDKNVICNDCKYTGNPFIRVDAVDLEGFKQLQQEMIESDARVEELHQSSWDEASTMGGGSKSTRIHYNAHQGTFTIMNEKSEKYAHKPVFEFVRVAPFQPGWDVGDVGGRILKRQNYEDFIKFNMRKDSDGKFSEATISIPYNDNRIRSIELKMEAPAISEEKAKDFYQKVINAMNSWQNVAMGSVGEQAYIRKQQEKAMLSDMDVVSAGLKTLIKGGSVEEATAAAQERQKEKEESKKGLFGGLFGKK